MKALPASIPQCLRANLPPTVTLEKDGEVDESPFIRAPLTTAVQLLIVSREAMTRHLSSVDLRIWTLHDLNIHASHCFADTVSKVCILTEASY